MPALKQAHGNWVAGDRFWDRETELDLFLNRIKEGANILLVAQRRMGKTSLMKEAGRRMEGSFTCVFVDFQDACSAQDAIAALSAALQPHKSLWIHTTELFANILNRVEKIGIDDIGVTLRAGLTAGNWAAKGDRLFSILATAENPVVLMLDEVPILVNRLLKGNTFTITPERRAAADAFLSWLRKSTLAHQGVVRVVLSGSIGLEPLLRQAGLSATVNNFSPFDLEPWDESVAVECLRALAEEYGIHLRDDVELEMIRRLGCCIPHHVQMFFEHAYVHCVRRKTVDLVPADIDEIYRTGMLGARGHAELTHYEDRLKTVLGLEKLSLAIEMLSEAALTGSLSVDALRILGNEYEFEGESTMEVEKHILWVLEHDGYLMKKADEYVFVSPLVCDWWQKSHGMFFVPASKREAE